MLRSMLGSHEDVRAAYLFGSYAKGQADAYSDLDLIVVADSERRFVRRFEDFPELDELGLPVELLVYTPEEFAQLLQEERPFLQDVLEYGVLVL